jgi:microcystin degradation protein MlrC
MRIVKTLTIGERGIDVRELIVADIRAWLAGLETAQAEQADILDATLFDDFSLADLARMTSLTAADMEALSPSELRLVFDAAKAVNADFFAMRGRLMDLGRAALAKLDVN